LVGIKVQEEHGGALIGLTRFVFHPARHPPLHDAMSSVPDAAEHSDICRCFSIVVSTTNMNHRTPSHTSPETDFPDRIVFYDGHCALCSKAVQRLIRYDRQGRLHYAPLQGTTARALFEKHQFQPPDSIIYWSNGSLFTEDRAVVRIGADLHLWWRWLSWIPSPLRTFGYRVIARYRYRWFGRIDSCFLPDRRTTVHILP
jgi:predicted DCC family thiol-disulfide oxidoreductase YuxK